MGHIICKDIYRRLGRKIENMPIKAPWNNVLYDILRELYSIEEADVVIKMPYLLSSVNRISRVTKYEKTKLLAILEKLCSKGLVIDLWINGEYKYMPSPLFVGIFEFTMMRTGKNLNSREWGKLFHKYMHGDDSLYAENFKHGEQISIGRALPYEETMAISDYTEILDYEKAVSLIDESDKFAIGLCSCRHEKLHAEIKECENPLDTCSAFGLAADYLIRHNMAMEVSKAEMLENVSRSMELGLMLEADNVKKNITFICHCCGCCCNLLLGISKFGYPNAVVTSSFIATTDEDKCIGCGQCAKACPIHVIEMLPSKSTDLDKKRKPDIDTSICLGCGVCSLKCDAKAITLTKREKRVVHPETTFERSVLQCLEKGTLQNFLFDNTESMTQQVMSGLVGAFLKLSPIKKALMSDMLRSMFLYSLREGARFMGRGWAIKI